MKFIPVIFIVTNSLLSFGQQKQEDVIHVKIIKGNTLKDFTDSLQTKILHDTSKFKLSDLIHTGMGTQNKNSYFPIFYVDNRYSYNLTL